MNDAARWGIDWVRVVENLRSKGMSHAQIAEAAHVSKTSVIGYGSELRQLPGHSIGERIIKLWIEQTGYRREDLPMWRRPMSVSEVLKAHA